MELRGNVPRDEEGEPEILATLLDPGAAPTQLGAVRPRSRAGLDLEAEPGRRRVDVVVREAHGEPAVAVRGQLHELLPEHRLRSDPHLDDAQQLDVVVPEGRDHIGGTPPGMTPAREEAEPVLLPETFGRRVEITDGEHDVVDPKHRPNR
jgi:hypothetical protein